MRNLALKTQWYLFGCFPGEWISVAAMSILLIELPNLLFSSGGGGGDGSLPKTIPTIPREEGRTLVLI
jgi:hypothetical protein